MGDKVSQGARELAQKFIAEHFPQIDTSTADMRAVINEAAALIDQGLGELLAYLNHRDDCKIGREDVSNFPHRNLFGCTCGLSALLAKWTVRG